jgi:hypothetical protein
MNTFKQRSLNGGKANHRASPVIALGKAALDIVWHPRIGDTRALEQRAIERWENEGGEIPNEQGKSERGLSKASPYVHYFSKAIST